MCLYAARRVPEISDNVVDVDRAMRWGFAWELGPFEIMDAIGLSAFAGQARKEGRTLPAVIQQQLASERNGLYASEGSTTTGFDHRSGRGEEIPVAIRQI